MPRAPCPGAGITSSGSRTEALPPKPSRSSPAIASSAASSPSRVSTLRTRVGTLPRSGTTSRSGRRKRTCAMRRRLDVPTRAPGASSSRDFPLTSASRGSCRTGIAPSCRPAGRVVGRSLSECTATSMRPPCSASSISFVKKPLPSSSCSGRSTSASPRVLMTTISARTPSVPSRSRTHSACQRASWLPRVPIFTRISWPARQPGPAPCADPPRGCRAAQAHGPCRR